MSISKFSNRWLNRTYKCIAILLVSFAVLISALRLFLPYAHNYRADLQNYINNTYESNIIIGSLNMGWQSSGPTLEVTNVSLLQTEVAEIYIQAFDINIDFWKSLRFRRLITKNFTLDGVKVLFDKEMLAKKEVSKEDSSLLDSVSELFLKQIGHFSVKNSQIIYRTDKGERTFLISNIDWLNEGKEHKARGNVILDGVTSNNLQVNLAIKGEALADMKGTVYVKANRLNITPWLDKVLAIEDENTHSTINFDAWLSLENGLAKELQVVLGQNQIAWQHKDNIKTINIDQGQIIFEHLDTPQNLVVKSTDIHIRSNEQVWQPLNFEVSRKKEAIQSYISTIDIAGLADLLPLFVKQETSRTLIEVLNPVGQVNDVYLQYADNILSGTAQFSALTTHYSDGIPGIENVSGEVILEGEKIQIAMLAKQGSLDFDKHFIAPMQYQSFSSTFNVQIADESWQLTSDNINFVSDHVNVKAEIGVFSKEDEDVTMSLIATALEGNVEFANIFYPHLLMGDDLVSYLNTSLQKGNLAQALILINGPLASFPYKDGSGAFVVDAELTDSVFQFDQEWPAIQSFDANLNFTNNSMMVTGRKGLLAGINVRGVTTGIADLSNEQTLKVDASFKETSPKLVSNLMLSSPLSHSVGTVLEKIVVSHDISGDFSLTLPLNNTDLALSQGSINFKDNLIALDTPQMIFSEVNGVLTFENEKINANNLNLLWRKMPITLNLEAYDTDLHYQTDIDFDASWKHELWQLEVPELLKPYADGKLDWQGKIAINNFHDGRLSYQLDIQSDLAQVELNLPAPYHKNIGEEKVARASVKGNKDQSSINLEIGSQLNFYGKLNHQQVSFNQAHLMLGDEDMYLPMDGFHITTKLDEANFDDWQPLVSNILNSLPSDDGNSISVKLLEQPQKISGNIGKVNFLNEIIHEVSFDLEDELSWWFLNLSSKEARAKVKFYPDWYTQGIDINADFINFSPDKTLIKKVESIEASLAENTIIEPLLPKRSIPFDIHINDELFSNMPPLTVSCADCTYGDLDLGDVSFTLERKEADLLVLNNFVAKRQNNKLSFDAQWQHNQQISKTQLNGEYSTKDIEREFERLGFTSTVRDSGLKSKFDINWLGGPQDFTIAHFSGDFSGELNEGYLAEVPDQARAFSILSIQSLVRKLKFDFRDIFSDGMFYSEIKGDFHLKNGVVYTKNTFLKGSAGNLSVKGNTDLNREVLDYSMSYKPNYYSSLPALAWIATLNPVTFLAGIAIDEVLTSQVVSEYKFEVTGNISKPNFIEVDRKTQNISVGRDSPPQIVENMPEVPQDPTGKINPETGLLEEKQQYFPDKTDG